ncbi:AAA family ATPase [Pseudarthrobacter enclensis]|uniref:AAA family ATPase n=1 Tax=Pseudarthrobacter enclensis TaxID=993070 RepID=UPI00367416EF
MARTDGKCLLYAGMVHAFNGESESCKSMMAQYETVRQLRNGNRCLYIDFESDAASVVSRLLMMGASADDISRNLDYIRPDVDPVSFADENAEWHQLLHNKYSLAVIDGVTEAFAVFSVKSIDNDEVTAWGRKVPRQIASKTGAAVVVVDHVTKSSEGRGRFAIGAQAKMSYLTGAAYMVEIISPVGVGMVGKVAIRIGKDRPGQVRPVSGEWRKSDRTQETAVVTVDSTVANQIACTVDPPRKNTDANGLPVELMESISRCIEDCPAPPSFRKINQLVSGKDESKRAAIALLEADGFISIIPGARNAHEHHSLKPFRAYPESELLAA